MLTKIVIGTQYFVTPLTERAARFLNGFVGRTITMTQKEWESIELEMPAHRIWEMGKSW